MNKNDIPAYFLTAALLAVAVYLRSPMTAIAIVGLWGVRAAEAVFTRKNRDADINEMLATMASHKAKMDALTRDITNVAERARTILGENF
jgi:hypothetical protein